MRAFRLCQAMPKKQNCSPNWAAWDALKLELFMPLPLVPEQRLLIEETARLLHQGEAPPAAYTNEPIPVAVLTDEALAKIGQIATSVRGVRKYFEKTSYNLSPLARQIYAPLKRDTRLIAEILLGDIQRNNTHHMAVGKFDSPLAMQLHADHGYAEFILRALSLPWEFVKKESEKREPSLIDTASTYSNSDRTVKKALRKLRKRDILQPAQINILYLFSSAHLLHCSGPVKKSMRPEDKRSLFWSAEINVRCDA